MQCHLRRPARTSPAAPVWPRPSSSCLPASRNRSAPALLGSFDSDFTVGLTSQRPDTAGRTPGEHSSSNRPRHHRRMNRQAIHDPHLAVHVLENPPRIPRGGVRRRMWADRTNRCRPDSTWTSTSTGAGTATRRSPRSRSSCSDNPLIAQLTECIAIVVNMSYGKDRTARTLVCQIAGTSTQSGPRTAMQTTSSTRFASKESS